MPHIPVGRRGGFGLLLVFILLQLFLGDSVAFAKTVFTVNPGARKANPEKPGEIINNDAVDFSGLGLGGAYVGESVIDAFVGLANKTELKIVKTSQYTFRSRRGNYRWMDYLKQLNPDITFQPILTMEDLFKEFGGQFAEILTYPGNPIPWGVLKSSCDNKAACPIDSKNPFMATCPEGGACSPYTNYWPESGPSVEWVTEKANFNRYLAMNFVATRRALPIPESVMSHPVYGPKILGLMGNKPVVALKSVIESYQPGAWDRYFKNSIGAHDFMKSQVFPSLNPSFVCNGANYDLCIQEGGVSILLQASALYPKETELLANTLDLLRKKLPAGQLGMISGWFGTEDFMACLVSRNNYGIGYEVGVGISALRRMPASIQNFDLNSPGLKGLKYDPAAKYVALIIADGNPDTVNALYGEQWPAYHTSSQAYRPPLTWQVRPQTLLQTPIVAQYLKSTRFSSDAFMMGPSGSNYINFTGMILNDGFSRLGSMMDNASASFGARTAEIWGAFLPSVDSLFSNPKYYVNPSLPNPFPYLVNQSSWNGNPQTILAEALTCSYPRDGQPGTPMSSIEDMVTGATSRMDAVMFPGLTYENAIANGTSTLPATKDFWNAESKWLNADGSLNVAAEVKAILSKLKSGTQFVIVTQMFREWSGPASQMTLKNLLDLAKRLQDAGVKLITIPQYYQLKRKPAFQPFFLNAGKALYFDDLGLYMQADSNLVLYKKGKALWASNTWAGANTCGTGCFAAFQTDGNLVVYKQGKAIWSAKTNGCGIRLILSATDPHLKVQGATRSCPIKGDLAVP